MVDGRPEFPYPDEVLNTFTALTFRLKNSEMDILFALAESDSPKTGPEIAEQVDCSQSTVYRAINSIEDQTEGFFKDAEDGYQLNEELSVALADFKNYKRDLEEYIESEDGPREGLP